MYATVVPGGSSEGGADGAWVDEGVLGGGGVVQKALWETGD